MPDIEEANYNNHTEQNYPKIVHDSLVFLSELNVEHEVHRKDRSYSCEEAIAKREKILGKNINLGQEQRTLTYKSNQEMIVFVFPADLQMPAITYEKKDITKTGLDYRALSSLGITTMNKFEDNAGVLVKGNFNPISLTTLFKQGVLEEKFQINKLTIIFDNKFDQVTYNNIGGITWGIEYPNTPDLLDKLQKLEIPNIAVKVADFAVKLPENVFGIPVETPKELGK